MAQPLINIPNSPFVDIKTGRVNLEWLVWLQNPHFITVNLDTVLGIGSGGTGQTSTPSDGQLLIGSTGSSGFILGYLQPTAHQTTISNNAGSITIGTAQDIGTGSGPTFDSLTITNDETIGGKSHLKNVLINGVTDDTTSKLQVQGNGRTTGSFTSAGALKGLTVESQGSLTISDVIMLKSNTTFTNGSGASAGTLTNAPSVGNPTKWIGINDNGTTRYIPAW